MNGTKPKRGRVSSKSKGTKPWWRSGTIGGVLVAGASALLSPEVLAILPAPYARAGVIIGAVWGAVRLRAALPVR